MEHQLDEFSEAGAHLMEDPDSFTLPLISYRPDIEPTERLEDTNFRERALDLAIAEINEKTDLNIERAKHRRVTGLVFAIKTQSMWIQRRSPGGWHKCSSFQL